MICPQCGFDIGTKHKCLRCGYEVKTLVTVDEEAQKKREKEENTRVIDPENTFLTDEYGNIVDDDDYYSDPISSLFDDLFGFDPIGDLLGGLFGVNIGGSRRSHTQSIFDERQERIDDKKDETIVEVKKVDIYDENGNLVKPESKIMQTVNKVKQKVKNATHKNDNNK